MYFFSWKSGLIAIICLYQITLLDAQDLTPTFSNIDYTGHNDVKQKMDLYIPPGLSSPAPVIIFLHGGGWLVGGKGPENVPFFQLSYNSGFICADVNYRLSTDSVWPAQIEDCKTAIRFLRENAGTFNIDVCRFGVIGESAGGFLAAMLGTTAGINSFEGFHLGNAGQTSRVQAVIVLYAPIDFLREDGYYPTVCGINGYIHENNSYETNLLGIDYLHLHQELVNSANPMSYITPDDSPFFIAHGADDCIVPFNQSILLDNALSASGIPADTLIIAAWQIHSDPYFKEIAQATLYNKFFLKHLSAPCSSTGNSESVFQNVNVFPNPATNEIHIDLLSAVDFKAEIIDICGKTVLKAQNRNIIDISTLKGGIYFLRLISVSEIFTHKIIKL
jgi:acetyl esterase/lipase